MTVYLGLGSNLGDRRANLVHAIDLLGKRGFRVERVSPAVESPAMLPDNAEDDWHRPYLNLALSGGWDRDPASLLESVKAIEAELGRDPSRRWSPRPVDIDILLWEGLERESEKLTIPHPGAASRPFVLTPLLHLDPSLTLSVDGRATSVQALSRSVRPIPLWMGIVNLTPDSFSGDGQGFDEASLVATLSAWAEEGVQIVDLGAESTRPNAESVDPDREWRRLQQVLDRVQEFFAGDPLRPLISVDTRHPAVAARALARGVDIINDVCGLGDLEMQAVVRDSGCQAVAMHSLTVPVQPRVVLPADRDPMAQLAEWLDRRMESWGRVGIDLDRMIFDPGIGFGKSRPQNLEILRRCAEFKDSGLRLLMGHSRKSFMGVWSERPFAERDPETLGISMALCEQGADIIRVHDPVLHARAYRAWSHVNA
ncbi:MAG: dihydropteroate synthase [Pseudomonadota bacterium]|nr:dihydropteroate synthase [Pseudomonadota bacterium]